MWLFFVAAVLFFAILAVSCTPVVVGGGAAGGYASATDQRSTERQIDDVTITTRVKAKMAEDASVKTRDIDVDTLNGGVSLKGLVDSAPEREKAAAIARSVPGVASVRNNLQIGSRSVGEALDDKNLGVRIKAKLIAEPGIRSLNVDVYRGVVYLRGDGQDGLTEEQNHQYRKIHRRYGPCCGL